MDSTQLTDFSPSSLDAAFAAVEAEARAQLAAPDFDAEAFRLAWLGRKQGRLKAISDAWLKAAPADAKRLIGQRFNALKETIEAAVETAAARPAAVGVEATIDITLPGIAQRIGAEHPLIRTMQEIVTVFERMGYSVGLGPEVETDFYNFEALNFPPNHPARDTQDTLVVAEQESKPARERLLMRTHTSPVQIRSMLEQDPPLRLVIPGKVHRNDAADATHSPVFHQVEGLVRGYEHHVQRPEGHAGSCDEGVLWLRREDAVLPVVLSVYGAECGCADLVHLLRREGLPEVQALGVD